MISLKEFRRQHMYDGLSAILSEMEMINARRTKRKGSPSPNIAEPSPHMYLHGNSDPTAEEFLATQVAPWQTQEPITQRTDVDC